jgi:hypothetical protein
MSRLGAFGAVIAFLANGVAALSSQSAGTAVIRGHVYDGDGGQPLRRALVRATAPGQRENRVATTDEQGRYELNDLPAGRYTVSASKGNFVGLSYGQTRPADSRKPLEILDGQTLEKVDFTLPRGGVITGHVVDEYGDPVPNTQVAAMRSQFVQGRRRLVPAGRFATTDDLGEYRLYGLSPADYYVSATYRPPPASAADADAPGYAATYFPGTVSASEAQRVALGVGRSLDEVNIALVPVKTAQIAGVVVSGNGQPMAGGFVVATERNGANGGGNGAQLKPDGTFIIRNMPPGEYWLRAQSQFNQGQRQETATTMISVAGQDINGIQLVVVPPSTASGVVLVDPAAAASIKASSIAWILTSGGPLMGALTTSGRLKDDFTFEATMVMQPGTNMVSLTGLPNGLSLKAVRVGGVDVTDTGFNVKPNENVSGIEIELTSHPTQVSGQVADSRGAAVKDCTVVIFARDERKWEGASRYIRTSRPDAEGRFTVNGLPQGDYHVVAVDAIDPGEASDPEFLGRMRDKAASFSLNEGETRVLDLKLTAGS